MQPFSLFDPTTTYPLEGVQHPHFIVAVGPGQGRIGRFVQPWATQALIAGNAIVVVYTAPWSPPIWSDLPAKYGAQLITREQTTTQQIVGEETDLDRLLASEEPFTMIHASSLDIEATWTTTVQNALLARAISRQKNGLAPQIVILEDLNCMNEPEQQVWVKWLETVQARSSEIAETAVWVLDWDELSKPLASSPISQQWPICRLNNDPSALTTTYDIRLGEVQLCQKAVGW